jgi:cytochrome P450
MSAEEAEPAADLPFGFDPLSRVFRSDPWATYDRMRTDDPVHRSPLGMWALTRHEDVAAALRDPRFVMGDFWKRQERMLGPGAASRMGVTWMLFKDPPDHGRLRGLVSRAFSPNAIAELRPRIEEIVDELLEPALERGTIDVVRELAFPLPVRVIAEMLGVPADDGDRFHAWTQSMNLALEPAITPDETRRCHAAIEELDGYLRALVRERRSAPRQDIVSAMIAAEEGGDRLSEDELVGNTALLLSAGYETTMGMIGNGALALLRFPGEIARLAEHPELLLNAIEEFMRYESPVQFTGRQPRVPIEIRGRSIQPGEHCLLLVGAANRDPDRFPDAARLDVGRSNAADQVSFGGGRHFCIGAPLARLEGEIAFRKLLPLLEGAELASSHVEWRDSFLNHAPESLPVLLRRS